MNIVDYVIIIELLIKIILALLSILRKVEKVEGKQGSIVESEIEIAIDYTVKEA